MPLMTLTAEQAVDNRKHNPSTYWGSRSGGNRVEPVARPDFHPTFTLVPGESIFTIGSCFARNVEDALASQGFQIPVREAMKRPVFEGLSSTVLNNYGTPSIFNELSWAFDPARPFVPTDHLLEVKPGQFVDVHLPPTLPPADWNTVLERRTAVRSLMQMVSACRIVVITLGLAEVWYDTVTGYYLNDTPRPSLLRTYPGRFELHVLSFDEAHDYLERALALLKRAARADLRVILTVSPVPLAATHRPMDVMVANTYSKSVLRAVADTVCCRYDWIDYFPSYESIVLSDRSVTWEADLVHVTRDVVEMNVARMLDGYLTPEGGVDAELERIDRAGRLRAEGQSDVAVQRGGAYAEQFFARLGHWSQQSSVFALNHAQHLHGAGRHAEALEILDGIPAQFEPLAVARVRAEAALGAGRPADAIAALAPLVHRSLRSQETWELLVRAHVRNGDTDGAIAVTHQYLAAMSYNRAWAFLNLARELRATDPGRAAHFFEAIVDDFLDSDPWIQWEIAESLAAQRRFAAARTIVARIKPPNQDLAERVEILKTLLQQTGDSR